MKKTVYFVLFLSLFFAQISYAQQIDSAKITALLNEISRLQTVLLALLANQQNSHTNIVPQTIIAPIKTFNVSIRTENDTVQYGEDIVLVLTIQNNSNQDFSIQHRYVPIKVSTRNENDASDKGVVSFLTIPLTDVIPGNQKKTYKTSLSTKNLFKDKNQQLTVLFEPQIFLDNYLSPLSLTIKQSPPPKVFIESIEGPTSVTKGNSYGWYLKLETNKISYNDLEHTVYWGDGTQNSYIGKTYFTKTYTSNGTYTISIITRDKNNNLSSQKTHRVTVTDPYTQKPFQITSISKTRVSGATASSSTQLFSIMARDTRGTVTNTYYPYQMTYTLSESNTSSFTQSGTAVFSSGKWTVSVDSKHFIPGRSYSFTSSLSCTQHPCPDEYRKAPSTSFKYSFSF